MSYTEMYKVDREGNVRHAAEFHNASHGAWLVWKQLCERYLPGKDLVMSLIKLDDGGMQEVWDLWKNPAVSLTHRIVMASTFDRVMVRCENLPRLIEAIEEYVNDFDRPHLIQPSELIVYPANAPPPPFPDREALPTTTLSAQARKLRELAQDDGVAAVCWNQTSVNCNPWWVYNGDDEEDEGRPYNINVDENHWFLFEGIDAQ